MGSLSDPAIWGGGGGATKTSELKISSREREPTKKEKAFFFSITFGWFPSTDFDVSGCFGKGTRCSFQKNWIFGFLSSQTFLASRLRGKGKFRLSKTGFSYKNLSVGHTNPPTRGDSVLRGGHQRLLRCPALVWGDCSTILVNLWRVSKAVVFCGSRSRLEIFNRFNLSSVPVPE